MVCCMSCVALEDAHDMTARSAVLIANNDCAMSRVEETKLQGSSAK